MGRKKIETMTIIPDDRLRQVSLRTTAIFIIYLLHFNFIYLRTLGYLLQKKEGITEEDNGDIYFVRDPYPAFNGGCDTFKIHIISDKNGRRSLLKRQKVLS
jgi:hypothetical protein